MRKLILILLAIMGLVIGGSGPAFAAPTKITSGATFLRSTSDQCGDFGTCFLYAAVDADGNTEICFESVTFDASGEVTSALEGCADSPTPSDISFTNGGASVVPTHIDLINDFTGESAGSVTVSGQDVPTGEKSYT